MHHISLTQYDIQYDCNTRLKTTPKTATATVEYISTFSTSDAVALIDKVDDGGGQSYYMMLMTINDYILMMGVVYSCCL